MAAVLPTQSERIFKVITPLDEDVLLFRRMSGSEELGRLFEFELDLLSTDPNISFDDVLGQGLTVEIERPDGETRYFNGIVSRFSYVGTEGQYSLYRATIKPWLWLLTRTNDCRVFQNMTVPDILDDVFNHYGFSDFEDHLSRDYSEREYCIQYRESAFDFVSRLMEHEGIYYYFVHEGDKHTLILADENSFHEPCPGYDTLRFFPPEEFDRRDLDDDHVYNWQVGQQVQSGRYALNDYNFESPKANLEVRSAIPREHNHADFEVYDYPGTYQEVPDGDNYVRTRIEEIQAQHEIATGHHNNVGLIAGYLFTLTGHTRDDQNREYLVISAEYSFYSDAYDPEEKRTAEPPFACRFTAMDNRQPFRPARSTPRPIVHGMHSAIVTGPEGGEIHTDKYGRVKVRFYWDRHGPEDDNSSCWVRVSQNRAGKEWGEVYLPHVDQEVLVSFEEGDPDRPIVTGRVYNNDNMPPLDLPSEKTKLMMRDQGGNQMVMEGKDGEQRISMYSPTGRTFLTLGKGFSPNRSVGASSDSPDDGCIIRTDCNLTEEIHEDHNHHCDGDSNSTVLGSVGEWIGKNLKHEVEGSTDHFYVGTKSSIKIANENSLNLSAKLSLTEGIDISQFAGIKISMSHSAKLDYSKGAKYTVNKEKEYNEAKSGKKKWEEDWEVEGGGNFDLVFDKIAHMQGKKEAWVRGGDAEVHMQGKRLLLKADKIILDGKVETTKDHHVGGVVHAKNVPPPSKKKKRRVIILTPAQVVALKKLLS
jgi:type VI secretion system secreted protein VgrG